MARISTYPISQPTVNDILLGSDADNLDVTKNYLLGDIIALIPGGSLSVQSLNTLTGVVTINGLGGITVTETGSVISIDGSNAGSVSSLTTNGTSGDADLTAGVLNIPNYGAGQFSSLTTLGNSGSATLISGVLNIPEYQRAITVTTSGSGAASLIGANLNIPYESISLTTLGNSGLATLTGDVLNIPAYQRAITVTTSGSGAASLVGANLNIPLETISLTTNNTSGLATLTGNILNVPAYQRAITVTTGGSGAASLIGANLNIPYESISLTVNGTSGPATLVGSALNIPEYQRAITVTTGGAGEASIIGAQLNIPYLNSYNTGAPTVVNASAAGSSSIPTKAASGATVNMYSCTWSGGNGNYTLTLPSATTDAYRSIRVITDGTFTNNTLQVILTPVFGQTINGVSSIALNKQYTGILVWSDGSNWRVIQQIS